MENRFVLDETGGILDMEEPQPSICLNDKEIVDLLNKQNEQIKKFTTIRVWEDADKTLGLMVNGVEFNFEQVEILHQVEETYKYIIEDYKQQLRHYQSVLDFGKK